MKQLQVQIGYVQASPDQPNTTYRYFYTKVRFHNKFIDVQFILF